MKDEFRYGIILTICITMATLEAAFMMYDYIQRKQYAVALLILVIAAFFSWEIAILMGLFVGIRMLRRRKTE